MDMWVTKSNPFKQWVLVMLVGCAGVALMIATHPTGMLTRSSNSEAFMLGALLAGIAVVSLFSSDLYQTVTVDPNMRRIVIESRGVFAKKELVIPFDTIKDVRITYLGKRSNYVGAYYPTLILADGQEQALFFPAYFDGRGSEQIAQDRRDRLNSYLGHTIV